MAKFQKKLTGVFKASVEDGMGLLAETLGPFHRIASDLLVPLGPRVRIRLKSFYCHDSCERSFLHSFSSDEASPLDPLNTGLLESPLLCPAPAKPVRVRFKHWFRFRTRVQPMNVSERAATLPLPRSGPSLRRAATMPLPRAGVAVNSGTAEAVTEEMDFEAATHPVHPEDEIAPELIASLQEKNAMPVVPIFPGTEDSERDLNRVEPRRDSGSGKTGYVYILHVVPPPSTPLNNHPDGLSITAEVDEYEGWLVDRRYGEWYVLESKLIEFHGQGILSSSLPSKRTFVNKGRAFVESHRAAFEGFLQTMMSRPELKGSQLLHTFLTSPSELTPAALHDILNPWRAMKKGAGKLSRERGQHLSGFIQSFMGSAAADHQPYSNSKPLSSKAPSRASNSPLEGRSQASGISGLSFLSAAVNAGGSPKHKLKESIFGNNCGLLCEENVPRLGENGADEWMPSSLYDLILFSLCRVLSLSSWLFRLLVTVRVVAKKTLDRLVAAFLRHKLDLALHETKQAELIHILRDVLFYEETVERSEAEKRERRDATLTAIHSYLRGELSWWPLSSLLSVGTEADPGRLEMDVTLLFNGLQHPRLNKHLSYQLLDLALSDLFPALSSQPHSPHCPQSP